MAFPSVTASLNTTVTPPGATNGSALSFSGTIYTMHAAQFVVTGYTAPANAYLQCTLQGSLDNTTWATLASVNVTGNGTFLLNPRTVDGELLLMPFVYLRCIATWYGYGAGSPSATVVGSVGSTTSTTSDSLSPADAGAVAWTTDPGRYSANVVYPTGSYAGALLAWAFKSAQGGIVNHISYVVTTAGAGLANCFMGIYSSAGVLLGSCSTDQTTNLQAVGAHTINLSAPLSLSPGTMYYVGMVMGSGTTGPTLTTASPGNSPAYVTLGTTPVRSGFIAGANTSLPGSFTPSSLAAAFGPPVFVLTT